MTVCIATACRAPLVQGPTGPVKPTQPTYMIVGASDRMLTAGDIEYEPPKWKVWAFGQQAASLMSGDAAIQAELWLRTSAELFGRTPNVRQIADTYARHFAAVRRDRAERSLLTPLGMNLSDFVRRQRELTSDIAEHLTAALQYGEETELDAETIICGVDASGVHIFTIEDPGQVNVYSGIGFAAIGMGQNHAESEFMFSKYTFDESLATALLLTYTAKKRAETAPGVGVETDMFIIGPYPWGLSQITVELMSPLHQLYNEAVEKEKSARKEVLGKIEQQVEALVKAAQQPRQTPSPQPQQPPQQEPPKDQPPSRQGDVEP